jgi:hypothetical protein
MVQWRKIIPAIGVIAFFTSTLYAARVTSVNVQQHLVYVDKGITDGYDEGVKVCFMVDTSLLSCGRVTKATLYQAQITLSGEIEALFAAFSENPEGIAVKKVRPKKKSGSPPPSLTSSAEPEEASTPAPPARAILRLLWVPTLSSLTLVSPNQISYIGADSTTDESLWLSSGPAQALEYFAFGSELSVPRFGLNLGVFYRRYVDEVAAAYYDNPTTGTLGLNSSGAGSELSVYLDYGYSFYPQASFGAGLEYTSAFYTYSALRNDATQKQADLLVYDLRASLSALSLRVPLRYDYRLGGASSRMGLSFGATAKVLLSTIGAVDIQADANDPLNGTKRADPTGDFTTALGYGANPLSADMQLGYFISW